MKSRAQKKDEQTDKFKQELLARRAQLLQSVRSHRQDIPDRGLQGTTGDSSDHAAADYATELFGALLELKTYWKQDDIEQQKRLWIETGKKLFT